MNIKDLKFLKNEIRAMRFSILSIESGFEKFENTIQKEIEIRSDRNKKKINSKKKV